MGCYEIVVALQIVQITKWLDNQRAEKGLLYKCISKIQIWLWGVVVIDDMHNF